MSCDRRGIVGSDMTRKETHTGTGEMVLGIVLVGVWFALKVAYREAVKEKYGFISCAYLRADLISLGVIIVVGAAGFWLLRRIRRRSG